MLLVDGLLWMAQQPVVLQIENRQKRIEEYIRSQCNLYCGIYYPYGGKEGSGILENSKHINGRTDQVPGIVDAQLYLEDCGCCYPISTYHIYTWNSIVTLYLHTVITLRTDRAP